MANSNAKLEDYSALDAAIGTTIEGEPLRFKDGRFARGFDKTEVAEGTRMMLHPASTSDGFIKWEDGKPVEWRIRELNSTQFPISRETLGDTDESEWPDGKDPWAFTMMVALKDSDGALLTFSTGTVGGKNAIRKVLRDWKLARNKYPGKVPVVSLEVGSYEHRVHRTTVEFPIFSIVDWAHWDGVDAPPPTDAQQVRGELNDALPDWANA
jgi:hypothetical protein